MRCARRLPRRCSKTAPRERGSPIPTACRSISRRSRSRRCTPNSISSRNTLGADSSRRIWKAPRGGHERALRMHPGHWAHAACAGLRYPRMKAERSPARERAADQAAAVAIARPVPRALSRDPLPASVARGALPVASGGRQMPGEVSDPLEAAFGHDFSAVRVHADGPVSALARDSGARAFALGADLAFAPGEWAPATRSGRAQIAHEMAHITLQALD